MRAGPAALGFDWSKAGLSMDLPVFVYSHTKNSFKNFLSRLETCLGQLPMWLQIFQLQPVSTSNHPEELYRALVLSRLESQARKLGPYFGTLVSISSGTKSKLG